MHKETRTNTLDFAVQSHDRSNIWLIYCGQ